MKYLSGCKTRGIADSLRAGTVGLLQTPNTRYALADVAVWAMDNGCFTDAYPGDTKYLQLLHRYDAHKERCLFVAAPDVVGDATATLALFPAMAARIKALGYRVALVGQDGMEHMVLPWDDFDWVFIGGSDGWKLGAGAEILIRRAQRHGKKIHVGRVNSAKRFRHFRGLGCDSADGTYLAFGPDKNLPNVLAWVRGHTQPMLFCAAGVA